MNTRTRFVAVTALATLGCATFFSHDASAAGTALDVQSARGTGMASAQTAMIDDSSAIFYNPAGMAQGKKLDAQVGLNLIAPSFSYTSPAGEKSTLPFTVVTPFQAYLSGGITDDLTLGIGVFTPFGLRIRWPDGWAGRSLIQEASLQTFYINPSAAYKIGPVRIGAGFQLVRATVDLHRRINFGASEGQADLGGSAWGYGFNVGAQLEAVKQYLTFGVHYRSAVRTDFDNGKVHFSGVPRELAGTLHDQAVTTGVTNPDSLAMGVSSRPIKDLVIDFDAVWLGWSKFHSIALSYPNDATGTLNSVEAKNWNNTVNFHLGAEGTLSEHFLLRGGVLIDPSPSPADTLGPDIPDSTRVNLALGGTWRHESGVHVDVGYQFIILTGKTSTLATFPGDYGGFVNILGLSVGYGTPPTKEAMNMPAPEPPPPGMTPAPVVEPSPATTPAPAQPPPTTAPDATPTPPPGM
jgi:long-chain fatty acid transport protein